MLKYEGYGKGRATQPLRLSYATSRTALFYREVGTRATVAKMKCFCGKLPFFLGGLSCFDRINMALLGLGIRWF